MMNRPDDSGRRAEGRLWYHHFGALGVVGLVVTLVIVGGVAFAKSGFSHKAAAQATSDIQLANVKVAQTSGNTASVSYDVAWTGSTFPGVYRCTWAVLDTSGAQLGSSSDTVAALAPASGLIEKVQVAGDPASVAASCDRRLDTGTPYAYSLTNVKIDSGSAVAEGAASSDATLSFDAQWEGTGTPGPVTCTFTFRDDSGQAIASHDYNVFALEGSLHASVIVSDPAFEKTKPASVSQSCNPLGSAP